MADLELRMRPGQYGYDKDNDKIMVVEWHGLADRHPGWAKVEYIKNPLMEGKQVWQLCKNIQEQRWRN